MNEQQAYTLAARVERTPSYGVLKVCRAWSAAVAQQVRSRYTSTARASACCSSTKTNSTAAS